MTSKMDLLVNFKLRNIHWIINNNILASLTIFKYIVESSLFSDLFTL